MNLQRKMKQLNEDLKDFTSDDSRLASIDFEEIELRGNVLAALSRKLFEDCCWYKIRANDCVVRCDALKVLFRFDVFIFWKLFSDNVIDQMYFSVGSSFT